MHYYFTLSMQGFWKERGDQNSSGFHEQSFASTRYRHGVWEGGFSFFFREVEGPWPLQKFYSKKQVQKVTKVNRKKKNRKKTGYTLGNGEREEKV